jgi:ribonuclease BN (tRNA processing enzyme)
MKIKVLGCAGAEFPGHNPPGFLLDDEILFDAGSLTNVLDEREQGKIKDIFITHAHLDHIRGIPFLADNIIIGHWPCRVNLFSIPPVLRVIKKHLLNSSMWPDFTVIPHHRDAILKLKYLTAGEPVKINAYTITPYKVHHSVPATGYLVEDRQGKRFFYTGDTGPSDATWKKLGGKRMNGLIIEVSFPNKMEKMAIVTGHLTAKLLRKELSKIKQNPEKIYITHLKPQYLKTIRKELQELKMKNLRLLRDGEIIRI